MEYLSVEIPVRLWQVIDGSVDNTMAVDVVDTPAATESVMIGSCVRDAGWRAAAHHGGLDQYGWPPRDHRLPIVLRREHWEWVAEQLERWETHDRGGLMTEALELIDRTLDT